MPFGEALRQYRQTRDVKTDPSVPNDAHAKRSALLLIDCMNRKGLSIGSGGYSEIEADISLPLDPKGFVETVASCLDLSEEEQKGLVVHIAYDKLRKSMGQELARQAFRDMGLGGFVDTLEANELQANQASAETKQPTAKPTTPPRLTVRRTDGSSSKAKE